MWIFENEEERNRVCKELAEERRKANPERWPTPEERTERERKKTEAWQREMLANARNPYELDPIIATFLYIVVMVGSLILKDFLYIWVFASFLYWRKIYRMFH